MQILTVGDPRLETRCEPVAWPDERLAGELAVLHETLRAFRQAHGYGRAIAAPQVGILERVVALQLGATPFALINPEYLALHESLTGSRRRRGS